MGLILAGLALMCTGPLLAAVAACYIQARVVWLYLPRVARIFQDIPLFIVPRGQPRDDAEVVRFRAADGLALNGCYFKAKAARRGVIVFGLEFGSNCWSAWPYCEHLVAAGFDVFAFESRNQGDSEALPGYEPIQWVTDHEVRDARAALAYVKSRPDADPRGVGLFGISKGAGAGVLAASGDPAVLCAATDGMFATATTLLPYMRQWVKIYNQHFPAVLMPDWYYRFVAWITLRQVMRERRCRFPSLEQAIARFRRPLLMIHGGQDTYIKPEMARDLFDRAAEPREFWLVEGAKHNQALHLSGEEYRERVLRFFERHLAPCGCERPAQAGCGPRYGKVG
jgi:uncharacterized protein